jgi:hypothetical protein
MVALLADWGESDFSLVNVMQRRQGGCESCKELVLMSTVAKTTRKGCENGKG